MGILQSRESYLEEEKQSKRLNRDTLRFPGFKENDTEFLEHVKATENVFDKLTDIISSLTSFVGLPDAVGTILNITKTRIFDSSLPDAILELKIEKAVVSTVHPLLKAEMDSITRQLYFIDDPQLTDDVKQTHLSIADNSCYTLLMKFADDKFYLRRYPLVFAPFLVSFVAVYLPIATANYRSTPTERKRQDYLQNIRQLRSITNYFKEKTIEERLKYIEEQFHGDENPFISDNFLGENPVIHILFYTSPNVFNEISNWYSDKVSRKYADYFQPALSALENTLVDN